MAVKITKIQKENKKLIEKYPFLKPRNVWNDEEIEDYDYSYTILDDMPEGWKKRFGEELCEDLKEELEKCNYLDKYRIVQLKEKYGCYDTKTQVLTKNGWKYFKDINYDDDFLTFDENNNLIYQKPTDIISYNYKGKMYHLVNRGIDLFVTPNHNLYVAKGSYFYGEKNNEKRMYNFEFCTPEKYFGKDKRFSKGGQKWIGQKTKDVFTIPGRVYTNSCTLIKNRTYKLDDLNFDIMSFVRFLGFYIAEGCVVVKNKKNVCDEIAIAYNPQDEENLVTKLIKDIGFIPKQSSKGVKRFYNSTFAHWLHENCGYKAWNKKVPLFIKNLEPEYIEEFLKYLYIGDGHKTSTYNILTTTSKQLSEDVEELLLKCGYTFRTGTRLPRKNKSTKFNIQAKHTTYEINWLKNTNIEIDMSKAKHTKSFVETWEDYNDFVYCVTIPTHIIYIKRNGKGLWCGNSLRWYDDGSPRESRVQEIIDKYEHISERTCICCGKFPVPVTDSGWVSPICKDCFENKINVNGPYEKYVIDDSEYDPIVRFKRFSIDEDESIIEYDTSDIIERITKKGD